MAYKAKKLTSKESRSRRRKTEREAVEMLAGLSLTPTRRRFAMGRIRNASKPTAEARRIVAQAQRDAVRVDADEIDFSDVQEIRVKMIRRRGVIDWSQAKLLASMDRLIATGEMSRDTFEEMAGAVVTMPLVLPVGARVQPW